MEVHEYLKNIFSFKHIIILLLVMAILDLFIGIFPDWNVYTGAVIFLCVAVIELYLRDNDTNNRIDNLIDDLEIEEE
jgi:membrane protein YdbS with pleckstrin-like domain